MMEVSYALCMGVLIGGERLSFPHNYYDGKKHEFQSDMICPNCLRVRNEYLDRKREERRESVPKFTEEDIADLEKITLEMYSPSKW
jgi:hypothetical protein